ncbi:MarR family winged helix-turn-helix transcriptional regulator [Marasmitruncus massiliensis]|uniref:MarR family winged helix-turn-helix transcriptional regulator n=1 Tax=Marasmitruncus massiliensis TaxID=1944642 RepID=UPI000C7B1353|nr:MarR family transcriptional regulator [Marasmitruncus massiliensis]MBE6905927.1 MarR family transcriptional regulator [Oscillospiraceae bacterium]
MDENKILHRMIDLIQYKDTYQQQSSEIQPQDMFVLERIYFHKTVQIRDLTKNYGIPPSTLTGILDRLERRKYIQRIRKENDRRAIELLITDAGNAVLQEHIREDKIFAWNLFHTLPSEERQQLLYLLDELLSNVSKENLFYEGK